MILSFNNSRNIFQIKLGSIIVYGTMILLSMVQKLIDKLANFSRGISLDTISVGKICSY